MKPSRRRDSLEKAVKCYWISWYQPTDDERPLKYPPNAAILGWWNSGSRDDAWTLCAAVAAKSEAAARAEVRKDWPEAREWRFCEEIEPELIQAGWTPGDRFPLEKWMKTRFLSLTPRGPEKS